MRKRKNTTSLRTIPGAPLVMETLATAAGGAEPGTEEEFVSALRLWRVADPSTDVISFTERMHSALADPDEIEALVHRLRGAHSREMLASLAREVVMAVNNRNWTGLRSYLERWIATLEELVASPELPEHRERVHRDMSRYNVLQPKEALRVIAGRDKVSDRLGAGQEK